MQIQKVHRRMAHEYFLLLIKILPPLLRYIYVLSIHNEEVRLGQSHWLLTLYEFTLIFGVTRFVFVSINCFQRSITESTEKKNFCLADLQAPCIELVLWKLQIENLPRILTFREPFYLIWGHELALTWFSQSPEAKEGWSVIKEAQAYRKFRFFQFWQPLPNILFNDVSLALFGRLLSTYRPTCYEYLVEIRVNCNAKCGPLLPHVCSTNPHCISLLVLDKFESIISGGGALDIVGASDHEHPSRGHGDKPMEVSRAYFLIRQVSIFQLSDIANLFLTKGLIRIKWVFPDLHGLLHVEACISLGLWIATRRLALFRALLLLLRLYWWSFSLLFTARTCLFGNLLNLSSLLSKFGSLLLFKLLLSLNLSLSLLLSLQLQMQLNFLSLFLFKILLCIVILHLLRLNLPFSDLLHDLFVTQLLLFLKTYVYIETVINHVSYPLAQQVLKVFIVVLAFILIIRICEAFDLANIFDPALALENRFLDLFTIKVHSCSKLIKLFFVLDDVAEIAIRHALFQS